jgi:hypothetical protein
VACLLLMLQNGEGHSGIPGDFVCPPETTPQRDIGDYHASPSQHQTFCVPEDLSPVCATSHLQAGSPEAVTRHFERRKSSFTLASPNCSIHKVPRIAKLSPSIKILASPNCASPHLRAKSPAALVASSGYKISGRSVCGDCSRFYYGSLPHVTIAL